jgi:hypothetical protein
MSTLTGSRIDLVTLTRQAKQYRDEALTSATAAKASASKAAISASLATSKAADIVARQAAIEAVISANIPAHQWSGTKLQLKNPNGAWGTQVDLRGPAGPKGDQGVPGIKGDTGAVGPPVALSNGAPLALGAVALPGISGLASRADHVHPMPSKADIGLANVENLSPLAMPISTAVQAALDGHEARIDALEVGGGGGGGGGPLPTPINITGNGTAGPYTLPAAVGGDGGVLIFVEGVPQQVGVDFSYAGNQLTFLTLTPAVGHKIYGWVLSGLAVGTPAPGSVGAAQIDADEAAGIKLALNLPPTVRDYGAVGDGTTLDHAAVVSARTAAGETGEVYYPKGTYRLSSRVGVPQSRATGPGLLTDGVITWPANRALRRKAVSMLRTDDAVVIDGVGYAHLPSFIEADDGALVGCWYSGDNHGQGDDMGVSLLHPAGTTAFTLNGNVASGGVVDMGGQGSRVQVICEGDETGRTFTFTGTIGGVVGATLTVAGVNAAAATSAGRLTRITAVSSSPATAGRVSIGLYTVPSDLKVGISDDGGQTWNVIVLGNGRTGWAARYYECVILKNAEGRLIVMAQYWDMVGSVIYQRWISDDNGRTWSAPKSVSFDFAWVSTPYIYGNPKLGRDGGIRIAAYDGAGSFVLTSYDDGATWTRSAVIAHPGGGQTYGEPGFEMLDDENWILMLRHNGATSAFKQFVSLNGGASWAAKGDTNLPITGSYVSSELQKFAMAIDGRLGVANLHGERSTTSTAPPFPSSIAITTARADDAMSFANTWSRPRQLVSFLPAAWATATSYARDAYVLASNGGTYRALTAHTSGASTEPGAGASWTTAWEYIPVRGGYPSAVVDEHTGRGGFAYAHEEGYRTSSVRWMRLDLNRHTSRNNGLTDTFVPIVVGSTVAGPNAYNAGATSGAIMRIGDMVFLDFEVTIVGSLVSTGNLSIQPAVAGTIPKPVGSRTLGDVQISITSAGINTRRMRTVNNSEKFDLLHETSTAFSFVTAAEVGADAVISGTIAYRTADP